MLGRSLRGLASSGGVPGGTDSGTATRREGRACAERGRAVERLPEKQDPTRTPLENVVLAAVIFEGSFYHGDICSGKQSFGVFL